ncbi:MAG TPA: molybdopterin oxidoreductase family protein [Acidimicrobiales bacterium]|nr:molybdopterin oxidoreductase family protein [Acidimicrobiales bacterium]
MTTPMHALGLGSCAGELDRTTGPFGLGQVPSRLHPDATTRLVCGYCSTGCSMDAHLKEGQAVNLTPTRGYSVNQGSACPKGWEALTPVAAPDRATTPLLHGRPVGWDEALTAFVDGFGSIIAEHGPESVAFLSTGQITSEEMALLGAVAKVGMGFAHGDGNTRQCMATSVAAHKQSYGFDSPPYTYSDFEASDVVVLVGSNLAVAHPILWERLQRNPNRPEIVVIDPRRTETAAGATWHVPIAPKGDLALILGLLHVVIRDALVDEAYVAEHCSGYDELAEAARRWPPDRAAEVAGLPTATIEDLAHRIGAGKAVSFWWTMGVNQGHQAVRTAQAIIDLALITGNMGRPGTGANSVTGQCNAMGSRLWSMTASLFAGRAFENEADRAEVAAICGWPAEAVPSKPSLAYDQIIEGVRTGQIKGLWVLATNTAHSWGDRGELAGLLDSLDLFVVQDLYADTDTARHAHVFLPAAGWGEKDGTMINSERRIGLVKQVRRPPGDALPDFAILRLLAHAWGCGDLFEAWSTPEEVFRILGRLSAGRPCDHSGIDSYRQLDDAGGIQWPAPAGSGPWASERRLFEDGRSYHPDGRFRLVVAEPEPSPSPVSEAFPLVLLTGRGSTASWHTETRTGRSALLRRLQPACLLVDLHSDDAAALGVGDDAEVEVTSAHGSVRCRARVGDVVQRGQVFLPMHNAATNVLTHPVVDPISRQPSYKDTPVAVRRVRPSRR